MIIRVVINVFVAVLDGLAPEYPYYMRSRPADAVPFSWVCVVRATLAAPALTRSPGSQARHHVGILWILYCSTSAKDLPIR